jgi:hypothetical protein
VIVQFKARGLVNAKPMHSIDWQGKFTQMPLPSVGHYVELPVDRAHDGDLGAVRWWEVRQVDHSYVYGHHGDGPVVTIWVTEDTSR